ncbi:ABC transporter ATP-binding protein [Bradyrhizobium roseum]|uniref:ABC transporter ATP-binding protein n=1 Tax=Bradyrhizobium roseum TaxID=3056648 RepID=UPI002632396B|nr:oligopeptide/dipeptide ABC transporter ATP-binding protein [Bradyrhizobium roseus]WKA26419.1 ATP-binding cassette domain-containing protein [Bradyrhizobium roseus]
MMDAAALLDVKDIVTLYGGRRPFLGKARPPVYAVDGVSLRLARGQALGLVGESGCGKTTLAKTILGLIRESEGTICLDGEVVSGMAPREARLSRRAIQYVHQDPGAALDPWWSVGHALEEALKIHGVTGRDERRARVDEILEAVGLDPSFRSRYPHELSGGQQRRIGLARILVLRPQLVVLDEPTSGLDLSVQATVLGLLDSLRQRFGLTYLFVSHDLSVVRRMCERVAIMYLGRIVESGPVEEIFDRPRHPYTRALLSAIPRLEPGSLQDMPTLSGDPPSASTQKPGCAFQARCSLAAERCGNGRPRLLNVGTDHVAACLRLDEIGAFAGA